MTFEQYEKKETARYRSCLAAVFIMAGVILYMGLNNMSMGNENKVLKQQISIKTAKEKYFEKTYDMLIDSGTCLGKVPEWEGRG